MIDKNGKLFGKINIIDLLILLLILSRLFPQQAHLRCHSPP